MISQSREWWRPANSLPAVSMEAPAAEKAPFESPWAFRSLIAFIIINVGAPQAYIPALGALRPAAISAIAAIGFALYAAMSAERRGDSKTTARELHIALALTLWATVTVPFSSWPGGTAFALVDFLKTIIILWLIGRAVVRRSQMRTVFWTLSWVALFLSVLGIRYYFAGEFVGGRINGVGGGLSSNPNDLAVTLNLILPMTVFLAVTSKTRQARWLALAIIAAGMSCIVVTFSRGGFVTLSIISLIGMWLAIKRGKGTIVAGVLIMLMVAIVALPSGYGERLRTIANPNSDETGSAQGRWQGMVGAANYVIAHPFIGAGLGQDVAVLNDWGSNWHSVHNAFLLVAVDLGVLGLALYLALIISTYRSVRHVEHEALAAGAHETSFLATAIKISLIGFTVEAMFSPITYNFYFFYLAGLTVALKNFHGHVTAQD